MFLAATVAGRASSRCIELDPATPTSELHRVWLHECGHVFDAWLPSRPSPEEREDYADEMAGLLATYQPGTLDQLAELALHAHEKVTGQPRHQPQPDDGLPPAGEESITAFRALPLTTTAVEV